MPCLDGYADMEDAEGCLYPDEHCSFFWKTGTCRFMNSTCHWLHVAGPQGQRATKNREARTRFNNSKGNKAKGGGETGKPSSGMGENLGNLTPEGFPGCSWFFPFEHRRRGENPENPSAEEEIRENLPP